MKILLLAMLMDLVPDDKKKGLKTPVWDIYRSILNEVTNWLTTLRQCKKVFSSTIIIIFTDIRQKDKR